MKQSRVLDKWGQQGHTVQIWETDHLEMEAGLAAALVAAVGYGVN